LRSRSGTPSTVESNTIMSRLGFARPVSMNEMCRGDTSASVASAN
jgi:hypothetical protein